MLKDAYNRNNYGQDQDELQLLTPNFIEILKRNEDRLTTPFDGPSTVRKSDWLISTSDYENEKSWKIPVSYGSTKLKHIKKRTQEILGDSVDRKKKSKNSTK